MRRLVSRSHIYLLLILLLALGVRLLGISSRPIWYDEAFSILFAEKGPQAMAYGTLSPTGAGSADIHPLEYYTLLWMWMQMFGRSLTAVRLLSVLVGLGNIAFIYLIGRELFDDRLAATGALISALAPFQVHFAQEIRMYGLLALWLMACTYTYLRGSRSGHWTWWVLFAIFAAAAQYTHNLAALYLIPLALTPLFRREWRTLRSVVFGGLLAVALYLPWLLHLPAQIAKVQQAYWTVRPGVEKFFTLLLVYTTNLPLPNTWLLPALFTALAVTVISLWQTFRTLHKDKKSAEPGLWLLYLAFAPPALAVLISQWQPIYVERIFLPAAVIYGLWVTWAIFGTHLPRPVSVLMIALLAAGAAAGLWQHLTYSGFPYVPCGPMGAAVEAAIQPGDAIIHSNKLSLLPCLYSHPELPQRYIADTPGTGADTLAPATRGVLGVDDVPDLVAATQGKDRVWFIVFQTSIDEYTSAGDATHPHLAWLAQHYRLDHTEDWDDLRVLLYTRAP